MNIDTYNPFVIDSTIPAGIVPEAAFPVAKSPPDTNGVTSTILLSSLPPVYNDRVYIVKSDISGALPESFHDTSIVTSPPATPTFAPP